MQSLINNMKPGLLTHESSVSDSLVCLANKRTDARLGGNKSHFNNSSNRSEKLSSSYQKLPKAKQFHLNSKFVNKNKKILTHDENLRINSDHECNENTGLFPRNPKNNSIFKLTEGQHNSNRINIHESFVKAHDFDISIVLEDDTTSNNLNTASCLPKESVETREFFFENVAIYKHKKFTNVEFIPENIKLLDAEAELKLFNVERKFLGASPFFQTIEFDPRTSNETGVLLKILNYEFENVDNHEIETEDYGGENARVNDKTPWYREYLDIGTYLNPISNYIKSFYPLSKEEYNKNYPWDKFYDAELYYDVDLVLTDDGELNMEMIPEQLEDTIKSLKTTQSVYLKKKYNYVQSRLR